jgi:hypothetical protein
MYVINRRVDDNRETFGVVMPIGTIVLNLSDGLLWILDAPATKDDTLFGFTDELEPLNPRAHVVSFSYRTYTSGEDYNEGEIILYRWRLYRCIHSFTASPNFRFDLVEDVGGGGAATNDEMVTVTFNTWYEILELPKTLTNFNLRLNFSTVGENHNISASITSEGSVNILSSSFDAKPIIDSMQLVDRSGRHFVQVRIISADGGDVKFYYTGEALTAGQRLQAVIPIIPAVAGARVLHNIPNLDSDDNMRLDDRGHITHGQISAYDNSGKPLVPTKDEHLVNRKYLTDELSKQRTLISTINPNNKYGWVDSELNSIPITEPINNGFYYIITANSKVSAVDVETDIKFTGTNSPSKRDIFVILGDHVSAFHAPDRCFLKNAADNKFYSVNYSKVELAGTDTEVTIVPSVGDPTPIPIYKELYLFIQWPKYFRERHLPPVGVGLLSNDTIISTGIVYDEGPPEAGGWKLIATGFESIAERVMTLHDVPNHGFIEGEQIYFGMSEEYDITYTGDIISLSKKYVDKTYNFKVDENITLTSPTAAVHKTIVKSSVYGVETKITVSAAPPDDTYTKIIATDHRWRKASAISIKMAKTAMAYKVTQNYFYSAFYGVLIYDKSIDIVLKPVLSSQDPVKRFVDGHYYYLEYDRINSYMVEGKVTAVQPEFPDDENKVDVLCFQVLDQNRIVVVDFYPNIVTEGGGEGSTFEIPLPTGLVIGNSVTYEKGAWKLANSTGSAMTAHGIIMKINGAIATVITAGEFEWEAHGLDIGNWYYLASDGTYTKTRTTTGVEQLMFFVLTVDKVTAFISQPVDTGTDAFSRTYLVDTIAERDLLTVKVKDRCIVLNDTDSANNGEYIVTEITPTVWLPTGSSTGGALIPEPKSDGLWLREAIDMATPPAAPDLKFGWTERIDCGTYI